MIAYIARSVTQLFIDRKIIDAGKSEEYEYGFDLLFSVIISFLGILLISVILGSNSAWFYFSLAFIPLRTFAGGYHANTHWLCNVVSFSAFAICLILSPYLENAAPIFILVSAVISLLIALAFAPIASENKPLGKKTRKRNRRKSIILCFFNISAAVLFSTIIPAEYVYISVYYFCGVSMATISMLVGAFINLRKKGCETND